MNEEEKNDMGILSNYPLSVTQKKEVLGSMDKIKSTNAIYATTNPGVGTASYTAGADLVDSPTQNSNKKQKPNVTKKSNNKTPIIIDILTYFYSNFNNHATNFKINSNIKFYLNHIFGNLETNKLFLYCLKNNYILVPVKIIDINPDAPYYNLESYDLYRDMQELTLGFILHDNRYIDILGGEMEENNIAGHVSEVLSNVGATKDFLLLKPDTNSTNTTKFFDMINQDFIMYFERQDTINTKIDEIRLQNREYHKALSDKANAERIISLNESKVKALENWLYSFDKNLYEAEDNLNYDIKDMFRKLNKNVKDNIEDELILVDIEEEFDTFNPPSEIPTPNHDNTYVADNGTVFKEYNNHYYNHILPRPTDFTGLPMIDNNMALIEGKVLFRYKGNCLYINYSEDDQMDNIIKYVKLLLANG